MLCAKALAGGAAARPAIDTPLRYPHPMTFSGPVSGGSVWRPLITIPIALALLLPRAHTARYTCSATVKFLEEAV